MILPHAGQRNFAPSCGRCKISAGIAILLPQCGQRLSIAAGAVWLGAGTGVLGRAGVLGCAGVLDRAGVLGCAGVLGRAGVFGRPELLPIVISTIFSIIEAGQ